VEKEIIILAKSYKHSPNYCIAGIDTATGEWVRPVSDNLSTEGAVPPNDIQYENGRELSLLDVVRIKLIKPVPTLAQPENVLYDSRQYWTKIRNGSLQEVFTKRGFDNCDRVFSNNFNKLADSELPGRSLLLLKIQQPAIFVEEQYERKKVTLDFSYKGIHYKWFTVSDIALVKNYIKRDYGRYPLANEGTAVFSLTGKYEGNGKYYKMLSQLY
jgi:hypothetical protein